MNTSTLRRLSARTQRRSPRIITLLPFPFLLATLLSVLASAQGAAEDDQALARAFFTSPIKNIHDRHIEDLGLVIWGAKPLDFTTQALQGLTRHVPGSEKPAPGSIPNPALIPVRDGHPEIRLDHLTIVARLQNSLDVDESKAQAATYQWISDAKAGDFWNVDAAAILDWYFPVGAGFFSYNTQKMAAHLRTGVAWERVTAGSAVTSVDLREAFLGIGFRLKPFNAAERQNFQHQSEFQLGLNYKENAITNDSQWSVDLNVQPVFRILPPLLKDKLPFAIGEHWLIHKSDRAEARAKASAGADTTQPAAIADTSTIPSTKAPPPLKTSKTTSTSSPTSPSSPSSATSPKAAAKSIPATTRWTGAAASASAFFTTPSASPISSPASPPWSRPTAASSFRKPVPSSAPSMSCPSSSAPATAKADAPPPTSMKTASSSPSARSFSASWTCSRKDCH